MLLCACKTLSESAAEADSPSVPCQQESEPRSAVSGSHREMRVDVGFSNAQFKEHGRLERA